MRYFRKWISDYTLESKQATNGKLKEVVRGSREMDKYIWDVGSVVVHVMPPQAGFDIIGKGNRIFYVWTNEIEMLMRSRSSELKEDEKAFVDSIYDRITVGNKSNTSSLVVEICSLPFSEISYKRVGNRNTKHLPVLRERREIEEDLDGKLRQITVHNFEAYGFGGNHFHFDGKKELFLVADGLVYVFERRVDKPTEGFGVEEILKRMKSRDKDYAIYRDSYEVGGIFSFKSLDMNGFVSHATASGKKRAKFIELTNVAFDPEHYKDGTIADILVPLDYESRKKLIDALAA